MEILNPENGLLQYFRNIVPYRYINVYQNIDFEKYCQSCDKYTWNVFLLYFTDNTENLDYIITSGERGLIRSIDIPTKLK